MGFAQKIAGLQDLLHFDNWPMLVLGRTFDRRTGLVTYRKGQYEILVDHHGGDENGTRACIVSDMYRRHLDKLAISSRVRLLDLGANGGGFPLMLLLNAYEVMQAVCVEMNPLTSLRLRVNRHESGEQGDSHQCCCLRHERARGNLSAVQPRQHRSKHVQ